MTGRLFRAEVREWPGHYLREDVDAPPTGDLAQAAVIDSESEWGRYLVDYQDQCAVEIHWLPEDEQMRHIGAAELPLWKKPEDSDPI